MGMNPIHRIDAGERELRPSVADGPQQCLFGVCSEAIWRCCGIARPIGRFHGHAAGAGVGRSA